eukprot:CAMPEP_0198426248 /NCGR_PEP_ID=MMETSP1452-20131203/5130_1 /TAXON_ID=1181717 /ORGANISM="Synchroma pusillum, Strain CCMP3072" /LENGTH=48 /DNA_ID= /DNA_START= /DNA_END= /DNA_ORIENTATION=
MTLCTVKFMAGRGVGVGTTGVADKGFPFPQTPLGACRLTDKVQPAAHR